MIYLKAEDFDIIEFYSYSVKIPESCKIFKVHQKDAEDKQSFKRMAKLIKDLQRRASQLSGEGEMRFEDNNIAWKLKHKVTGKTIFVADSDWEYSVGLRVKIENCKEYNFLEHRWSDTLKDTYVE